MSFRSFLEELDRAGNLGHVKEEVSPEYEIASVLDETKEALIFEDVGGYEKRVSGNIYGTRERIARGLGTEPDRLLELLRDSLKSPKPPATTEAGPAKEVSEKNVDLNDYPILKHFEKDAGPYVTSSIFVGKDSDGNRNLSFHRLKLIGGDKFAIRLVPRHLERMFTEAEEKDEPLEVAAFLGVEPGVALAAATSPDYGTDEYAIANALSEGLELTKCETVDLEVPSGAEIVLEGKLLPDQRAPEGPFADITRTYDAVRDQPVFKVEHITHREDPIYPALLPGSAEHRFLMGMPREPLIYEAVDEVAEPENVALTEGGCGWLHGVVSIEKEDEDDAKKAIDAAFEAHSSLKHVVIVDEDIDVYEPENVEWAIATRFRGDRDIVVKPEIQGSSLDPTADPETRLGTKTGLDATKDMDDPSKFERAIIPK